MISLNQPEELPDLVGLRLTLERLKVDQLRQVGVDEYMMTSSDSSFDKSQRLYQSHEFVESDVVQRATSKFLKQSPWIHSSNLLRGYDRLPFFANFDGNPSEIVEGP